MKNKNHSTMFLLNLMTMMAGGLQVDGVTLKEVSVLYVVTAIAEIIDCAFVCHRWEECHGLQQP